MQLNCHSDRATQRVEESVYMAHDHNYYVYIMSSKNGVLYIGFTANLYRRTWEHKKDLVDGFSKKYRCHYLVYAEHYNQALEAIAREKQLKKWRREKKINLIESKNPEWKDLSNEW